MDCNNRKIQEFFTDNFGKQIARVDPIRSTLVLGYITVIRKYLLKIKRSRSVFWWKTIKYKLKLMVFRRSYKRVV